MNELVSIAKALGDETRLRAFACLQKQELCVCQITELLQVAPSTISKHMSILKQAGLVQSRKDGRWMFYRWSGRESPPPVKEAIRWVKDFIGDTPQIQQDCCQLERILTIDPEVLCRKQNRKR